MCGRVCKGAVASPSSPLLEQRRLGRPPRSGFCSKCHSFHHCSCLLQCQLQRCAILQQRLPPLAQGQWCNGRQQQQHHDAAQLLTLAERVDDGEKLGGGWSSVCNMSRLQPCSQPPPSSLSLCPWCMRLASASVRSLRRARASPDDVNSNKWAGAGGGGVVPLQVAVLSARLLYGAGLSCLCARVLHDANQTNRSDSSSRQVQHQVLSALLSRCRCDSLPLITQAAAACNATLSTGMPSIHLFRNHSAPHALLLPALTLFDSMHWQHFDTSATLACPPPSTCLWFRTLDALLPQIIIVDCLETGRGVPPRGRGQIIVFLCLESSVHLPHTRTPAFLQRFDITATYHRALPLTPSSPSPLVHLCVTYAPPSCNDFSPFADGCERVTQSR